MEIYKDKYDISSQYLDLSGEFLKKSNVDGFRYGFDWAPALNSFQGRTAGGLLVTTDFGPVLSYEYRGVPFLLRTGITAQSSADTLYPGLGLIKETENHPGFYGAFQLGNYQRPFVGYPVFFEGSGFGRSVDGTGMAILAGSVLSAIEIGSGDSILLFYGDTLFNGKEGYIGESVEGVTMINTPWKIERNSRFSAGVRLQERASLSSAFWYGFSLNDLRYPSDDRMWDGHLKRHNVGTQVGTDPALDFGISGDFRIEWREFERNRSAVDSSLQNRSVMTEYNPRLNISLHGELPVPVRARYDYMVSRVLTEFPVLQAETALRNDRDRLTSSHRLSFSTEELSGFVGELYGELTYYTLQFLRSHQSSRNRSEDGQRLGLVLNYESQWGIGISEHISAEAKKSDHHFREFHTHPFNFNPPWYSRGFSSLTALDWVISELYAISLQWNKRYSDYGYWYGREYMVNMPEDTINRTDFYAIAGKSVMQSLDFSFLFRKDDLNAQLGVKGIEIHDRIWDQVYGTGKKGYIIEPYIRANKAFGESLGMSLLLSHTAVIGKTGFLGESGIWDVNLLFEGGF
ncbi:hypothetical protein CHISP_2163 [Chitinispirillum alkaliphilum]|nr:hypothetical protein CHISP_2163 [Chitinispirillum alkaliphilum]